MQVRNMSNLRHCFVWDVISTMPGHDLRHLQFGSIYTCTSLSSISNNMQLFVCDLVTHPCPKFADAFVKPPLKLRRG